MSEISRHISQLTRIAVWLAVVAIGRQGKVSMRGRVIRGVIWGNISRPVNGDNVLGGL